MTAEIITARPAALAAPADMPPQVFELYQQALARGPEGVGALAQLLDLQERIQRRSAELEFSRALAEFQAECPAIQKSSTAKITTGSGSGYSFKYADLEEIIGTVRPFLMAHGFAFTFDSETDGRMLKCVCTLRHSHGHRETSSFTLPTENKSGASEQQKVGGALTYAKRKCLESILGLSLTDPEEPAPNVATITDEQRATILALIDEVKVQPARFCDHFKVASVAELPAARYAEAVRLLEGKRKAVAL